MDDLLKKYNDYIRLKNCRAEYRLSNGNFFSSNNRYVHSWTEDCKSQKFYSLYTG